MRLSPILLSTSGTVCHPNNRAACGSEDLTRFLQAVPDYFPVYPLTAPPLPEEFRMVYFDVNDLDGFTLAELFLFMDLEAIYCVAHRRVSLHRACLISTAESPRTAWPARGMPGLYT